MEPSDFRLVRHIQNHSICPRMLIFVGLCSFSSSVSPGFEAMKDQNTCNKIMVKLIQNCRGIFDSSPDGETCPEERSTIIAVKVSTCLYEAYTLIQSVRCSLSSRGVLLDPPAELWLPHVVSSSNWFICWSGQVARAVEWMLPPRLLAVSIRWFVGLTGFPGSICSSEKQNEPDKTALKFTGFQKRKKKKFFFHFIGCCFRI